MIIPIQSTLYEAIKDRRVEFENSVAVAVQHALASLGDKVYQLDWANQAARRFQEKQAA